MNNTTAAAAAETATGTATETETATLDQYWDLEHPERVEATFRDLVRVAKEKGDSTPAQLIELLTQLARAQGLQGKLPTAETTLAEVETLLAASECGVAAKISYLLERGRILFLAKTPALARPMFVEAWTLASQSGEDFYAIEIAQMLAKIEPPKVQKDWTLKALSLAEHSSDARVKQSLCTIYPTLGWHFFELRQYDKALELFQKALVRLEGELPTSHPTAGTARKIIATKYAIGKSLRLQNRFEDALKIQQEILAEVDRSGKKDGGIYEEMAECLSALKRTADAEVYFKLAHAELSLDEWFKDNKPERIKRLKEYGKVK